MGNPGLRYASTRHNIGFVVVDELARDWGGSWSLDQEANAELADIVMAGSAVQLAKPLTFMNRSGAATGTLCGRLQLDVQKMLVVVDDFLLDFGRLRFRRQGSDGGHNGLASIIESARSNDFPRLRCGIGSPDPEQDVIDFVLSSFAEHEDVDELVGRSCKGIELYLQEGIEAAMNRFNGT